MIKTFSENLKDQALHIHRNYWATGLKGEDYHILETEGSNSFRDFEITIGTGLQQINFNVECKTDHNSAKTGNLCLEILANIKNFPRPASRIIPADNVNMRNYIYQQIKNKSNLSLLTAPLPERNLPTYLSYLFFREGHEDVPIVFDLKTLRAWWKRHVFGISGKLLITHDNSGLCSVSQLIPLEEIKNQIQTPADLVWDLKINNL